MALIFTIVSPRNQQFGADYIIRRNLFVGRSQKYQILPGKEVKSQADVGMLWYNNFFILFWR
jgi:hypothetical protein